MYHTTYLYVSIDQINSTRSNIGFTEVRPRRISHWPGRNIPGSYQSLFAERVPYPLSALWANSIENRYHSAEHPHRHAHSVDQSRKRYFEHQGYHSWRTRRWRAIPLCNCPVQSKRRGENSTQKYCDDATKVSRDSEGSARMECFGCGSTQHPWLH